jgi:hypothetical protein
MLTVMQSVGMLNVVMQNVVVLSVVAPKICRDFCSNLFSNSLSHFLQKKISSWVAGLIKLYTL